MTILKDILEHEAFPALGCTEPISRAYAVVAIVYQRCGIDMEKIKFAMDNVIGDLRGLTCDGAKPGCTIKAVTAVDTAIRSRFMAIDGYGLPDDDGIIGTSPESSISSRQTGLSWPGLMACEP